MANLNSTATFKADISNLRSQMQAAAREVRLANSEFKKASAGMDDWAHSADGLEAKIKQLNKVLEAQKKQVALAKDEFEKVKKLYGENSAEANRAEIALNKYEASLASTEKELEQYGSELEKAQKYGDGFNDALDEILNISVFIQPEVSLKRLRSTAMVLTMRLMRWTMQRRRLQMVFQ